MKFNYRSSVYLLSLLFFVAVSCTKNHNEVVPEVTKGNVSIQMGYRFDASAFVSDTLAFTHPLGYKMSVVNLQFYLSDVKLINADGSTFLVSQAFYFDAKDPKFNKVTLIDIPAGNYSGMSFNIGLDSLMNKPNYLPATVENNNMEWPLAMGGGYHFMKLEGNYTDTGGTHGYAMHVGRNENLVPVTLSNKSFTVGSETATVQLKMNISEWFKNPAIYDFNIDGNYSMSNMAAMAKLRSNGKDVFYE